MSSFILHVPDHFYGFCRLRILHISHPQIKATLECKPHQKVEKLHISDGFYTQLYGIKLRLQKCHSSCQLILIILQACSLYHSLTLALSSSHCSCRCFRTVTATLLRFNASVRCSVTKQKHLPIAPLPSKWTSTRGCMKVAVDS